MPKGRGRVLGAVLGAGPQDTLNEKGQIDIEEVESVQSHLPVSFYAEGAGRTASLEVDNWVKGIGVNATCTKRYDTNWSQDNLLVIYYDSI